jgi:hypothetical protein
MKKTPWIIVTSFILSAAGFLMPFWPLSVAGVLLSALTGRIFFALFLGLLLDIAWGPPPGYFHILYLPFVLLSLVGSLVYMFAGRYLLSKKRQETV